MKTRLLVLVTLLSTLLPAPAFAAATDFALRLDPGGGATEPGGTVRTTVIVTRDGDAQDVTLSVPRPPTGVTASFSPPVVASGGTSALTLTTSELTPVGGWTIVVEGSGPSGTRQTVYGLTVGHFGPCDQYANRVPGSLPGSGATAVHPRGTYFETAAAGRHTACLSGPQTADFDLYLQRWTGSAWATVASSAKTGSEESISWTGAPGRYRYGVTSYSGSGAYWFGYRSP
ncbi:hypothetical protein Afil01_09010 [Actinorhabdospora filicis]|uniref:Uncharacterized protein n=1 Tax=Actinorhabdospora filicis TaxID=1785913 RepID=A0A9W6SF92_9ACTN|nr:hypothetical protein [Actinorhabdospora filicis]GLZ76094.1 hypothetical protein Afil01_09010 [Actinorhabdospora filicis]